MKKTLLLLFACSQCTATLAQTPVETLIAAERQFARQASETNAKVAFLANSTAKSIMFQQNKPVNVYQTWQAADTPSYQLLWQPAFAGIASSGEMGFTTGPYIVEVQGKQVSWGQFSSLWEKDPTGQWKFVIDIGISHDSTAYPRHMLSVSTVVADGKSASSFIATEKAFQELVKTNPLKAYQSYTDNATVLLRNRQLPVYLKQGTEGLSAVASSYRFTESISKIAQSKDFAFVSGKTEFTDPGNGKVAEGSYMRVWMLKEQRWKIALETIIE